MESPFGKSGAAARLVRDLNPLAFAGEEHRVVTDHIPAPDRSKANRAPDAFAGHALAGKDPILIQ
jgi:hypothetical protein